MNDSRCYSIARVLVLILLDGPWVIDYVKQVLLDCAFVFVNRLRCRTWVVLYNKIGLQISSLSCRTTVL
jgi:hypothetical protein